MGKLSFFFLFILSFRSQALVPQNFFQNDLEILDSIILHNEIKSLSIKSLKETDRFLYYSKDPLERISNKFNIPKYFKDATHFWFNIYTLYESSHAVIHDKENLKIVYNVLDYSELRESGMNPHTRVALQVRFNEKKISTYKKSLINLSKGKKSGEVEKEILQRLKNLEISIPKSASKRKRFFLDLSDNIRTQTGQKDNIFGGLKHYASFQETISQYFKHFNAPKELLAIAFLESSFNSRAKSKVGATGVWQFMRRTGRYFMDVNTYQDGRLNPLLATAGALHLLKQNFRILGRWDLAVPAYNSGTKHILRAKRRLSKKFDSISLELILQNYSHPPLGFASQNFYSSFLALVHALAYKKEIYEIEKNELKPTYPFQDKKIKAYLTLCKLKPSWFFRAMKSSAGIKILNKHIKKRGLYRNFPPGLILFSDVELTSRRYYEIKPERMPKRYPKNWQKLAKGQSCSTK